MGATGTVVLLVVVLLVLVVLAYAASTRAGLVRMRDLAVEAGALAEQRRSRLAELSLQAAGEGHDETVSRAVRDAEQRLAGDIAFHDAAVRAYDSRLAAVPASWIGALSGLHPLGAGAEDR